MDEYTYNAMDLGGPAIRLFRVHRGSGRNISGDLFQAFLYERGDAVAYEALSYTWGPPDVRENIFIDGRQLSVTVNLYLALQQLRQRDEDRILWIDAICIDQQNLKERGHQVQQMGDIYKQADRVLFWLGAGTDETDIFIKSMQLLHRLCIRYPCKSCKLDDSRWEDLWKDVQLQLKATHGNSNLESRQRQGLEIILDRPWFRRVWILQEVANAKSALLYCGTQSVSVRVLSIAPILMGVDPSPHCQAVLDIMPGIWRGTSWWSQSNSLYTLLKMFGSSEATESRDLLYALRGISSDARNPDILPPDYEKPEEEVTSDAIRFLCCCDLEDYDADDRRSLPTDVRSLADGLDALINTSCLALAKVSKTKNMEMLLRRPDTQIGRHLVNTVLLHDTDGEMTRLLFQCRGSDVDITEEALTEAARNEVAAEKVMAVILQHRKRSTKITNDVLHVAARNSGRGEKVLKLLSPYIKSTNIGYIAEAAALDNDRGHEVIEMLFRVHCAKDAKVQVRRSARISHKQSTEDFRITQELLEISARNEACGADIFEVLFKQRPQDIKLSRQLVQLAIFNKASGFQILKLFLEYQPGSLELMESVARYADEPHAPQGRVAFRMFLEHLATRGPATTREFAIFTRWCTSTSAREYLRLRGRGLAITREVVQALALNHLSRDITLQMLLRHTTPILELKREAALEIIAILGSLAMDWLLQYRPKEYTDRKSIQSEVLDELMTAEERQTWNMFPFAAGRGHQALVELLLERGANIEEKLDRSNVGPTALSLAAAAGHKDIVAILIERGADLEAKDLHGRTPLILAAEKHESIAELLIWSGAKVDAVGDDGRTPLMAASRGGFRAIVLKLLDQGAGFDDKDMNGRTALMNAAIEGHHRVKRRTSFIGKATEGPSA
ncbi:hypothetical protein BBK36DRAFT_1158765 [Trichoderma citrinoviride]|uniref:Heterokaryon incompatibility domain-containing protein n=1 Tax=Trichoderma citrinoviride TaxID=58853 RepID=A0A2T4BC91_9HYPO|nr:hypothetical protein BBK36DRAFT_1158765 [Trichoderma citrinoviride]PTB66809.1 hypothetical protein BBK36DRAFT_1158765 [Trichoderma citrinoviride]